MALSLSYARGLFLSFGEKFVTINKKRGNIKRDVLNFIISKMFTQGGIVNRYINIRRKIVEEGFEFPISHSHLSLLFSTTSRSRWYQIQYSKAQ